MQMSYWRFASMIATSTLVMFGLMYLNTYALSHVEYSQTRTWMAIVMGAVMAIIMLGFMWGMYPNRRANLGIVAGAVIDSRVEAWMMARLGAGIDHPLLMTHPEGEYLKGLYLLSRGRV